MDRDSAGTGEEEVGCRCGIEGCRTWWEPSVGRVHGRPDTEPAGVPDESAERPEVGSWPGVTVERCSIRDWTGEPVPGQFFVGVPDGEAGTPGPDEPGQRGVLPDGIESFDGPFLLGGSDREARAPGSRENDPIESIPVRDWPPDPSRAGRPGYGPDGEFRGSFAAYADRRREQQARRRYGGTRPGVIRARLDGIGAARRARWRRCAACGRKVSARVDPEPWTDDTGWRVPIHPSCRRAAEWRRAVDVVRGAPVLAAELVRPVAGQLACIAEVVARDVTAAVVGTFSDARRFIRRAARRVGF